MRYAGSDCRSAFALNRKLGGPMIECAEISAVGCPLSMWRNEVLWRSMQQDGGDIVRRAVYVRGLMTMLFEVGMRNADRKS